MSIPLSLEELELDLIVAKLAGQDRTDPMYWIVIYDIAYGWLSPIQDSGAFYAESDKRSVLNKNPNYDTWYYFRTQEAAQEFYAEKTKNNF